MVGGWIQSSIHHQNMLLSQSALLSWGYLQLQGCSAGDWSPLGIQHQESQDQGPQRLEGDISYHLHYKHYFGSCDYDYYGFWRIC